MPNLNLAEWIEEATPHDGMCAIHTAEDPFHECCCSVREAIARATLLEELAVQDAQLIAAQVSNDVDAGVVLMRRRLEILAALKGKG